MFKHNNKYSNTYHSKIKTKSSNIKSSTYIDFGIENSEKDPEFNVFDHAKKYAKNTLKLKILKPC